MIGTLELEEINKVIIGGELVRDSAFGHAAGGSAVATFKLAFPSNPNNQINSKNKKGVIDIIFFGAEAHSWVELLRKGTRVIVKGSLQQRSWKTLEGIHRSKTEIVANQVEGYNSYQGKNKDT